MIAREVYLKAGVAIDGELPKHSEMGGYPLIYLCHDGAVICHSCVNEVPDFKEQDDPQWNVVNVTVYWEGPPEDCAHCHRPIESAYGDPEER
jgi:hypothetical protein